MVDLHCHSTCSDGEFSPSELLKRAENLKLSYFSITDHNNCLAYEDLDRKLFSGELITGVEITTSFERQIVEILGYGMDTAEINEVYSERIRKESMYARVVYDRLIDIFEKNGIHYTKTLNLRDSIDETWKTGKVKQLIYNDLIQYEENKKLIGESVLSSYSNFNKFGLNNPNSIIFINEHSRFLSIQNAVDLVHRNGGLCFLAHIYQYDVGNHIEFLNRLRRVVDLDGVEVYHSSFSEEQIREITEYADRNGLYKSGGSDFHGRLKLGYNLGMDMRISDDVVRPWINRLLIQ